MGSYEVVVTDVPSQPTLVVPATTTWRNFPALWRELSGEVWACLRATGINSGCPNVMLYLDDVPHVEVGVELWAELAQPCPTKGRVVRSALPAGRVATTVHRGPYSGLGAAHQAIIDACAVRGLALAGPRWEVYGPHRDDPDELTTTISYLLL